MYTLLSLGFVLLVGLGLGLTAFRYTSVAERCVRFLTRVTLGERASAIFWPRLPRKGVSLFWFQVWTGLSCFLLLLLALGEVSILKNKPNSMAIALVDVVAATGLGAVVVLLAIACLSSIRWARGYETLASHGVRALWRTSLARPDRSLCETFATRARSSKRVSILDVTGFDFIGKGPGASGALLYDALSIVPSVPVQVLLLEPESRFPDPDQKKATVFQTVLAETETSPPTYQRLIRATLDAIEALNEKRAPEARIRVAFYGEKPSFRMVLFDDSVLAAPCHPKQSDETISFLDVSRDECGTTIHEGFRRHFARLWGSLKDGKNCSTVVALKPVTEPAEAAPPKCNLTLA